MKTETFSPAVAALSIALVAGCSGESGDSAGPDATALADVKEQVSDATDTVSDYATAQKDQVVARLDESLEGIDAKMETLSAKMSELKGDTKELAQRSMTELKAKRDRLGEDFSSLKESTADAWTELSAGIKSSVSELEQALDKAAKDMGEAAGESK